MRKRTARKPPPNMLEIVGFFAIHDYSPTRKRAYNSIHETDEKQSKLHRSWGIRKISPGENKKNIASN